MRAAERAGPAFQREGRAVERAAGRTGQLALDGTPFALEGRTGSLAALTDPAAATPWPVRLTFEAAGAKLAAEGSIAQPLQARGWRLAVEARIPELQRLAPLLPDAPLPPLRDLVLVTTLADGGPGALPALSDLRLTLGPAALDALLPGLQLASLTASLPAQDQPLTLAAEATLSGVPLRLGGTLGAPALLLAATPQRTTTEPWPLDLTLSAATATAALKGTIADLRNRTGIDLALALRVPELAALSPLAGTPLPAVRDIALDTHIAERGPGFAGGAFLRGLRLTSSAADTAAELTYVVGQRRGFAGTFASTRIDLDALRPPEAAAPAAPGGAPAGAPAATPAPPRDRRVIPDLPLPLEALRVTDSDLRGKSAPWHRRGHASGRHPRPGGAGRPGTARPLYRDPARRPRQPARRRRCHHRPAHRPARRAVLRARPGAAAGRAGMPGGTTGRAEFDIDLRGQGRPPRVAATAAGHVGLGVTSAQLDQGSGGPLAKLFGDLRRGLPQLGQLWPRPGIGIACFANRGLVEGGLGPHPGPAAGYHHRPHRRRRHRQPARRDPGDAARLSTCAADPRGARCGSAPPSRSAAPSPSPCRNSPWSPPAACSAPRRGPAAQPGQPGSDGLLGALSGQQGVVPGGRRRHPGSRHGAACPRRAGAAPARSRPPPVPEPNPAPGLCSPVSSNGAPTNNPVRRSCCAASSGAGDKGKKTP